MNFIESLVHTIVYWLFGALYIGVLMGGAWVWNRLFGDGQITFLEALISAAIVAVPIVVGKVITTVD